MSARLILHDPRITRVGLEASLAAALASLAVSPFLFHALAAGPEYVPKRSPFSESADLLNLVVPTRLTWVRPPGGDAIADRFTSSPAEQGAYVGLPFLALLALAVRSRTAPRLTLGAAFTVAAVLALGPRVKVAGTVVGIAPWDVIARLPFLGSASPIRLSVFAALAAAVGVALALADRPNRFRAALAAAGVIATLPNPGLELWASKAPQPMFFAHEVYRRHLGPDDVALVLPYGPSGWSMLWHAQADFGFRMVGGHFPLRVTPREEEWRDVYTALGRGRVAPCRLRSFLEAHAVDVVIVAPGTRSSARRAVQAAIGREPVHSQDVRVYARDGPVSRAPPRAAPANCRA